MTAKSSTYKQFRTQLIECQDSGNLVKEPCVHCGRILLVCKKHGGQCKSQKCLPDRLGDE